MEVALFSLAFAAYAFASALSVSYLFRKNENLNRLMWAVISFGVIAHLASFAIRTADFWTQPENRFLFPVHTLFGILSWLSLVMAVVFWVVEGRHRLNVLGAFVLPWTVLVSGGALLFADPELTPLSPTLQNAWLNLHPFLLMAAYAAFANAFGVGVALLLQQKQLKARTPTDLVYRLPAVEDLDDLLLQITAGGFVALSAGLGVGMLWAQSAWGRFWGWDPKETLTLLTWLLYATYLYQRLVSGLRGRRTAYVSMAGFAGVLVTFIGVRFLEGLHGF